VRLLFFGTIRPYKGLEVLVDAFDDLAAAEPDRWHLTVVGEVWEGHTLPLTKIAGSPHRDLVDVRTGYVPDDELEGIFASADLVVLPYLRAAASGPLHLAMTAGLPVVVTSVGGLTEAAQAYAGVTFSEPGDPKALAAAIRAASSSIGTRYDDPHSWDQVAAQFERCFASLDPAGPDVRRSARTPSSPR
jgi:glycosyltransferase involved in cell wall biosynthesis